MKIQRGNVTIISIMLILYVILTLFIVKDKFLYQENISNENYRLYILDKFKISLEEKDRNQICKTQQKEHIIIDYEVVSSHFECRRTSLFINRLPTKKYLNYGKLDEVINMAEFNHNFYVVERLSDLPDSDINNPKLVWVNNEISERLEKDFYGIIVTQYPFHFTNKKIYGVFISPYLEDSKHRNISYNNEVIMNLNNIYSIWEYSPNTRNVINKNAKDYF